MISVFSTPMVFQRGVPWQALNAWPLHCCRIAGFVLILATLVPWLPPFQKWFRRQVALVLLVILSVSMLLWEWFGCCMPGGTLSACIRGGPAKPWRGEWEPLWAKRTDSDLYSLELPRSDSAEDTTMLNSLLVWVFAKVWDGHYHPLWGVDPFMQAPVLQIGKLTNFGVGKARVSRFLESFGAG